MVVLAAKAESISVVNQCSHLRNNHRPLEKSSPNMDKYACSGVKVTIRLQENHISVYG